ncbi:Uma2 family endonuclease [Kamptonema animale CS-326]|jgi:Uma2 family endonuclease|uniref:Uma2 family endonuclease n=1 Tax=Kamptonema animale TaxID=92934 RepID=UPI00232F980B|nr:Uma2 family endonuclease [Kamptonema animale]MDB9513141.1 Uma2 family endonuclease [Kamptonema animale CS-326]
MQTQERPTIEKKPQTEKRYYTPEEYLALEEAAIDKSEYHDGEIVPMTGGTTNHNSIIINLIANLKFSLRGKDYTLFTSDVRLWIPLTRRYVYPDIMVIQGEPVYQENNKTIVTNPLVIIEILSNSTQDYDRGGKFLAYRSIPEFREYILIDQYSYHIEQFAKNSNRKWELTEYDSEESVLILESVEFQIPLKEIYERINFEAKAEEVNEPTSEIQE